MPGLVPSAAAPAPAAVQEEAGGAGASIIRLGLGPKNSGWPLPGLVKPWLPTANVSPVYFIGVA
jgi:hypothetical protein